jgi:tetratricopeptide (TPR) repeat protein
MSENPPQSPPKAGDNISVAGNVETPSPPNVKTIRNGTRTEKRRKHIFISLEICTVLIVALLISFYGNLPGTLGAVSFNAEHYSLAGRLFRAALLVQEKIHGSRSLALNEPLNDLAYFDYNTDQMNEAVLTAERSLSICQEHLGAKHPQCAWTLSVASLTYDGTGDFVKAERMAKEALPILEASDGKQSWPVASTLNRLGMALDGEGRFLEAETTLGRALAVREAFGGTNWKGLTPILRNLASVYSEEGKENEATICRQRVESIEGHRH